MNLTEVCIKKPVFAWMLMAATVLFGLVAASRIGVSQYPDVDFPTITVSASWEGAVPEAVESDLVEPLEEAVVQVEGVKRITSSSRQGGGSVSVEFDIDRDIDAAMQDVQAKVAEAQRRLPREVDPPTVSKSNPEDQPIMWVGLSGPFSQQVLSDWARYRVKEKIQTVPGVGEVWAGTLDRNVRIWVNAHALEARGLTVNDLVAALRREHVELPAGYLATEGREVSVRVLGEALDLESLRRIVVKQTAEAPVYLYDVALVEDGFEDQRRLARVNGEPAQGLGIKKQRGSNAVAVAQGIRARLAEVQKEMPEGMQVGVNFDSTRFIEESVHEIQLELVLSCLLTALVCWMFLGSLSSTLNVILAIPMSLLGTVAVIYFLGFTLNTFTLLGLALAVGIVVDDAIMVLENIYRHGEMGKDRESAAREGTKEITFAALAATLAVVAIFIPVVFMDGVVGKFFLQFGITLCIAVLLSYLEAITLAPARSAQLLKVGREERGVVGRAVDRGFSRLEGTYARILGWALKRPLRVLLGAVALLAVSGLSFAQLRSEMVPSQDQSRLMVRVQTAVGNDLKETDGLFRKAEAILIAHPEIERTFAIVGGFGGGGVNSGMLFVTLVPPDKRMPQAELQSVLRRELNSIPGLRAVVIDPSASGFTASRGFPIELSVKGNDWEQLVATSQQLKEKLAGSGLAVDVDTDYQVGMPELRIVPDRARTADLGVPVEGVATTLNTLVGGGRVGKYSSGGRRIDVRMQLLADQRSRPEDIALLKVRTESGALVPLSSLITQEEQPALQAITREDRERSIRIFANVAPGHAQDEVLKAVDGMSKELPEGVRLVLSGASVAYKESSSSLVFALVMGILVAYMVLASQFNSFLHPVTVLTILPLSVAGAFLALWMFGISLNIFSMIGLLLLMGIVKKNSIILVEYALHGREAGLDAVGAMLKAGPTRLRPILMTSIATMMAAVPAAIGLGAGSETRRPMAVAVLGGLVLSTLLSLVVVPAFYVVADRAKAWLTRRTRRGAESELQTVTAPHPVPLPEERGTSSL
ncbi:MAG: efflux RND transporter permease subunit [Myxococcaceae bacterium]|nr:efflux RND transporter permease subunit [Myxococcaceae bacterium]